ncbi:MAG TPA: amino acid adenylation domain-containing protein, partial [Longimicrobiaceae bacterium]|nr:amino acid adenylation domain-containing protein [Longimicrobiaceae bacterium]
MTQRPLLPVHRAFEAQARRTPSAVALESAGAAVTYAELDARAALLAAELRGGGVGPEVRVGVRLERSPELVAALLGVLKAGGAYVPLDPGYPEERLAFMAADSGAALVLDGTPLPPAPSPARAEGENGAGPDDLAYVIYTSGSTGTPKGVMVPHGALASHMAWMQREFPLGPGDRVLQKTPFSFDASVWEFWAPLLAGATLVLAPPGAERDPAGLARLAARERVTVLQAVPTLLRAVLEAGGLERCAALRRLFCGGEALTAELAERARSATGAEVVNLYGPTETCIDATFHRYDGAAGATVPIGRATDGVRAYVLDGAGEPAADGELFLGGAQVARGYLGRPELTAERFVPDPFAGEPGARMYRSGDRARGLATGELEFAGRRDDQVKVRGFRVELGEVEAAHLHLVVQPPRELQLPRGEHARPVAAAVHARPRLPRERVADEALRGQLRPPQVPARH